MRNFYRWILIAHPRAFRQRFESEMLCVFDEAVATEGSFRLMTDGILSLLRQRLFRRRPAHNMLQAAAEGLSLFSSALSEQQPVPLKISRLLFGAAISFNLFVITFALIGRGHAQRHETNSAGIGGSSQLFKSGMRIGNTLAMRGQSEGFPLLLLFRTSAEAGATDIQAGSDSQIWVNIPLESVEWD